MVHLLMKHIKYTASYNYGKGKRMSHRIMIVEDNIDQLNFLRSTILSEYPNWLVHTASDYSSAEALLINSISDALPYTLFLKDNRISDSDEDQSGFALSELLRSYPLYYRTPILFLTSVSDARPTAISQFHCYNYISKPYSRADIIHQIQQMLLTGYLDNFITIHSTDRISYKLLPSDIQMITARQHILHITANRYSFNTREYTLSQIITVLGNDFVQFHKSYLVRRDLIENIDFQTMMLRLKDLGSYPIGKKYLTQIANI